MQYIESIINKKIQVDFLTDLKCVAVYYKNFNSVYCKSKCSHTHMRKNLSKINVQLFVHK